jgi:uncharacterized membrane protein YdfJ with MMPL/SSD domain
MRSDAMRGVGRALILCAATTVAGFGSLGFSSNAGLASLGRVCAVGVACMAVAGIGLLPAWWGAFFGGARPPRAQQAAPLRPADGVRLTEARETVGRPDVRREGAPDRSRGGCAPHRLQLHRSG